MLLTNFNSRNPIVIIPMAKSIYMGSILLCLVMMMLFCIACCIEMSAICVYSRDSVSGLLTLVSTINNQMPGYEVLDWVSNIVLSKNCDFFYMQ